MTTAQQVKKLVAPLLAKRDNLALVGRLIVVRPLHHILRGIFIDRTLRADQCQPRWLVAYLFAKTNHLPVGHGELIYHPTDHWYLSDPNFSRALSEVIEQNTLPKLARLGTIRGLYQSEIPHDCEELQFYRALQTLFLIALGELDEARDIIKTQQQAWDFWIPHLERIGLKEKLFDLGDRLDAEDRTKLANLLHEWEAYTVDKLKLRSVWERTPFPLEGAGQ